ncbi:RagB/SusD family nutrient uptake outer membrane protein [Chitinophaga rhizophila]|uniref:RagB/SusD family nutrient uptake outer membrane protein n=1 Tax=Chitinophaga rhizophila TaxID=2866212 RepID=A0ABS7GFH4_9BACT|nr:RagB/SusD family nutrient uptake outer membrane protein [Chitinophaga rhizophila]MBW8685258.1 RagB/SusD family nutrient uptake outer membrane protein [Chitinophaga rhizophila]
MKTRQIPYIIAMTLGLQLASGCSDSFLEVKPKGTDLETNYYRNATEAFNGLIAIYDVVGWQGGNYVTKIGAMNAGSDDHLAGGGGPNDVSAYQVFSKYTLSPAQGPQEELWRKGYAGIFRANTLLGKLPGIPMDENLKKRFEAESRFLRAYFYFDLVRMFKNIPLLTQAVSTSEMYDVVQAPPAEVYNLIIEDLKAAIAEPSFPDQVPAKGEGGRATRGAAHALLGKVYLYQERWAEAATEFAEVNGATPGQTSAKYGYKLLERYEDLWNFYSNKFNSESIFEIAYSSFSGGNWDCISCTEGNVLNIMVGPRGYNKLKPGAPDMASGWSFLVVTKSLFDAIHFDPRYKSTVLNMDSLKANGIADYSKGYDDTGYFLYKFAAKTTDETDGPGNKELNYPQNMYEIRLADTYLMEAEALLKAGQGGGAGTRAYALLNAVRARVGLTPVTATDDNIFRERRVELAGEGHRWFDLVRTGRAVAALGNRGFTAGKHEILPIPLLEMENTKIEQSKEWGGTK